MHAKTAGDAFGPVEDLVGSFTAADPTYAGQLCAFHAGEMVVDLAWGPGYDADTLLPVFSSSKGGLGLAIGCLLADGAIDLDAPVSRYWPEFAAAGKEGVTIRQLASHQAGLIGVSDGFTWKELYAHEPLAARLAAQRPFWAPGTAHGYHGLTIGTLVDELVRRVTGRTFAEYFAARVALPRGIDVHYGTTPGLQARTADVDVPTREEMTAFGISEIPRADPDSLASLTGPVGGPPLWVVCNTEEYRRAAPPAAGAVASARGLAAMYACIRSCVGEQPPLLDLPVMEALAQQQTSGPEMVSRMSTRFAVVFQKPTEHNSFGSYAAFGHDGAGGSLAWFDPLYDLAVGYVVKRIPLPGGADQRAIEISRALRKCMLDAL